jgi:class 3 adenylate cyclase
MSPTIKEQIERLKSTIAEMEAQRDALGDAVVQKAVDPLRDKLEELNRLLEVSQTIPLDKPTQQRKLVTLLFMDIAGSTAIAQHMDPEDVSEVFDLTLKKLSEPVEAHGGRVTRFMGDGFLSVLGAPIAHEDDPEQAVRAGLKIIELAGVIAQELEEDWGILDFQVRVGINTGLVLLGGETEAEDTLRARLSTWQPVWRAPHHPEACWSRTIPTAISAACSTSSPGSRCRSRALRKLWRSIACCVPVRAHSAPTRAAWRGLRRAWWDGRLS